MNGCFFYLFVLWGVDEEDGDVYALQHRASAVDGGDEYSGLYESVKRPQTRGQ